MPARVAAECGVRYVLHGSYRLEGGHVRISAQLTDACSQTLLWADSYDCRGKATFEMQDRITAGRRDALIGSVTSVLVDRPGTARSTRSAVPGPPDPVATSSGERTPAAAARRSM